MGHSLRHSDQSFKHLEFENHGRTVRYTPTITCVPNTAQDVTEIIKYAKNKNMGVRVSGFREEFSPYPRQDILLSLTINSLSPSNRSLVVSRLRQCPEQE